MNTDPKRLEQDARVFKALAHPSRLAVVEALACGERCVCELQELVGSDMSTVSRHLSVLKNAGVIADEKKGQWVFYRLILACVPSFLHCLRHPDEASGCLAIAAAPVPAAGRKSVRR